MSKIIGTFQFPAMRKLAMNSGDAFILVYSVDSLESFEQVETIRQTILDEREEALQEVNQNHNNTDDANTQNLPNIKDKQHINGTCTSNNDLTNCKVQKQTSSSLSSSSVSSSSANSSTNDVSRRSSVSAAEAALKIRRTPRPPMVIVANKCDLPLDRHVVNSDEAESLVVMDWNNGFCKASAAANKNINNIFKQILLQAKQPQTMSEAIISKRRRSLPPKLLSSR